MQLGFFTHPFPDLSLEEVATWASDNGFDTLELACWPLDYVDLYVRATHIDVTTITKETSSEIRDMLSSRGIGISALSYYSNPLDPDPEVRNIAIEHLGKLMRAAEMLKVPTITTFVGRDSRMNLDDSFDQFRQTWPELVKQASEHGVQIAIENAPLTSYWPHQWPGGENLASAPHIWRRMFDIIPDEHFGLNLDPSHLILQMIDYLRVVDDFGDRILHIHAKDETLDQDGLYEYGAFDLGLHTHIGKVPGRGDIDWSAFIGRLHDVGYEGAISIELEDATFERDDIEWKKRGLLIGRDVLRPYVK